MEINLTVLKTQTSAEFTRASASAAVQEDFALALDQAVSAAQEKTTAADQAQPVSPEQPLLSKQMPQALPQELTAILSGGELPDVFLSKTVKKTENKLDAIEPETNESELAEQTE
jgi:hypothetical protein